MNPNGATQTPRRSWPRRHKILTALLAIVGLFVVIGIASAAGSGGSSSGGSAASPPAASSPASASQAAAPAVAHIGQAADDGKFSFTVTSVGHAHSVGDGLATAQGHYVVLTVTVRNIGTVAQTFDDSAQFVYDSARRQFSADGQADIYGNQAGNAPFLQSVNPGNSVTGRLYFDLPRGDHAVQASLHDSVFSGGVTVDLTS